MNNSGKQQSFSDREVDDQQQSNDDSSPEVSPATTSGDSRNGNDVGLAARLTDLFAGDGDRDTDLLMQRNTEEGTVVHWLQALDMQVMGACRADERLQPFLKLNVSSVAEDRLLSHLSQHFEPSEVGLLARCLCIPLVSIRVGKINKQGTRLIPTSARGNLVLSLLPSSDLRISFLGDNGGAERLSILRNTADCCSVLIKEIPADTSGRSFSLQVPNSTDPSYFWCSEKSKLLGNELLEKMRKLLERKPSLTELTGISNSRLQRFVHHLQTYLVGSTSVTQADNTVGQSPPLLASKSSRVRTCSSVIQGSLSPRPSSFKEGNMLKNLASLRNKLRRRSEGARIETSEKQEKNKLLEPSSLSGICLFPSGNKQIQVEIPPPILPYYCWCPPVVSTLQYMVTITTPAHTTTTESLTLPPLSLPSSSFLTSESPLSLSLPPFVPLSIPPSQLFPPLMCEPIVHIPVIDICSSSYLVSIPPLVQESDTEKSARDTLRLLLSGSSHFPSVLANTDGIANSFAAMSLVTPGVMRRCIDEGDLVHLLKDPVDTGGTSSSCSNEDGLSEGSIE